MALGYHSKTIKNLPKMAFQPKKGPRQIWVLATLDAFRKTLKALSGRPSPVHRNSHIRRQAIIGLIRGTHPSHPGDSWLSGTHIGLVRTASDHSGTQFSGRGSSFRFVRYGKFNERHNIQVMIIGKRAVQKIEELYDMGHGFKERRARCARIVSF
jgi:hypothetical protein